MHRSDIHGAADKARIQSRPYGEFMAHASVADALADAAHRYADRRALTYIVDADPATPPRTWTYSQLLADIHRSSRFFQQLAGDEPVRIAMLLPAIPEAYLTLWGGEAAGVVCPINYLLDAGHIAELVRAADCNILVALGPNPELDIWSRVPDLQRACPRLRHVLAAGGAPGHEDFMKAIAAMPAHAIAAERAADPNRIAALFHTGGTTGAPKLAQHTHANQLHAAWGAAQMYAMREQDVILNGFPLFHVAGAFVYGLSALLSGAEVVLPTLLGLRNPAFARQYWTFVERHGVTLLAAVPTVIATLLGLEASPAALRSVRMLLTGGSPLPTELAAAFERKFGKPVRNILGMTECGGVISIEPFHSPRVPGSCGLPLPFTEVKAVTSDGRECAAGESGILRVRGPNVGPGYTDTRRNAGTFTVDGWLITGDIGHLDAEGRVFVTGRAKDVIIRGGHNIDPQVIEEALLQHPDVLMAAAVGEPDEYAGELPVAFVSLRPGATITPQELSSFANERIPERPAYPKRIDVLPAIPMTAIGKVFKPRLRMLACERVLQERLDRAGLLGPVQVKVEEAASGLSARFENTAAAPANAKERIAELMQPFAIDWRFAGADASTG
ncbi:acyl-CoA synthase [Ramlibacter henchirensis]|uniref:Acyl-CoA synthase n=1 Tax=Ramlibacter henchirensis TaxID=204072 RepID=A0A4Z0C7D2_9BURK|nr:AMP-binding protein [Ramlibacter henchirensis]TFZ07191.1 acyl-CoA synthase [Ramlibacter henchirensis]